MSDWFRSAPLALDVAAYATRVRFVILLMHVTYTLAVPIGHTCDSRSVLQKEMRPATCHD